MNESIICELQHKLTTAFLYNCFVKISPWQTDQKKNICTHVLETILQHIFRALFCKDFFLLLWILQAYLTSQPKAFWFKYDLGQN